MARIYLVRHGRARATWREESDPGLDDLGREQARQAAETLAPKGPLDIMSSPLARARETSVPLVEIWKSEPRIEKRVGEIVSPIHDLEERFQWLIRIMREKWPDLDPELNAWRQGVGEALCELKSDTVVFSHFIAINAAVGAATGSDSVVNFWPSNGSITVLETDGKKLSLVELGKESFTRVG